MNRQLVGSCMLIMLAVTVHGFSVPSLDTVVGSAVGTGKGITLKIPDLIPSPNTLLTMSKQAIVGMPFQVAMEALNKLCSVAISGNSTQGKYTPDASKMGLLLKKGDLSVTHPLTEPHKLWEDPLFDRNMKLVVYVTGWLTDLSDGTEISGSMEVLHKAYSARGGYNFVVLDSARFIDSMYSWSAYNTEEIGRLLAEALLKLVEWYPLENIHLMGHSLGGQIVGATGRHFNQLSQKFIPRITGLDPANPCFSEGEALTGIYRGDADFVDIIHTNNGALGQKHPVGDADFYPNGAVPLQPGCLTIVCAHQRAWALFAETVYPGNEENFPSTRCNSLIALGANMCHNTRVPMGFACPSNLKGNFFLKTRSSSPYGENYKKL